MTLLRPGMTARYVLPDGSVYSVTIARDPEPPTSDTPPQPVPPVTKGST